MTITERINTLDEQAERLAILIYQEAEKAENAIAAGDFSGLDIALANLDRMDEQRADILADILDLENCAQAVGVKS